MTTDPVRIIALNPAQFTDEQQQAVGDWSVLNFSRVLAHHPALYRVYVPFIEKVISFTELPPRDREVIVLYLLSRCGERYELGHHIDIARDKVGMSEADIEAITDNHDGLSAFDKLLVRATEELLTQFRISDTTWAALAATYSPVQLMEVVGLVGCYSTMAMMTRSFGIQPEDRQQVEKRLAELRTYD